MKGWLKRYEDFKLYTDLFESTKADVLIWVDSNGGPTTCERHGYRSQLKSHLKFMCDGCGPIDRYETYVFASGMPNHDMCCDQCPPDIQDQQATHYRQLQAKLEQLVKDRKQQRELE